MAVIAHLGDRISHGGQIVEASEDVVTEGRGVARVGDTVRCMLHGTVRITTGDETVLANGRPVAFHGSRCSCGASVIADGNVFAGG